MKYLIKVVRNEVVNSNRVVSNVVYGTVYNLITSLLDAFDPECMGLGKKKIFVFHNMWSSNTRKVLVNLLIWFVIEFR